MIEIIIFIIIMTVLSQKNKKKKEVSRNAVPTAPPVSKKPQPSPQPGKAKAKAVPKPKPSEDYSYVEPSRSYRPARNAAQRYEEWFPVPEGKEVVRCRYCAADNLIPRGSRREQYTCYFCREEL